jgi:hypothetical protein
MHLLIPFAFCSSDGCRQALRTLPLPQLQKLLAQLTPLPADRGDELSLSAPHERALARALGLPLTDGLIPWAAHQAQARDGAWGFITPCHWQVGSKHIAMSGPALPDFSAQESQTLLAAMQPFFAEDGITLHYEQPQRWLARSALFDGLATASLDRVGGRDIGRWMPEHPRAALLRRLQTEMQMLLYTHPVNEARAQRGVPPVNSFWLSGTGALPAAAPLPDAAAPPQVVNHLREAALREDWPAWAQAWATIDATECAALRAALAQGQPVQLTLCGERSAQTLRVQPQSLRNRFMNLFATQTPSTLLEQL